MKHAYLIMAHTEPQVLRVLLDMIDDPRNDLYLHIDRKTNISVFEEILRNNDSIHLVPRISVYWGHISQVKGIYRLMEAANSNGPYLYYHFLSGVDLPIKSQDYIHKFCLDNIGKEFIGFTSGSEAERDIAIKTQFYWLFLRHGRDKLFSTRVIAPLIHLQKKLGITRRYKEKIYKGDGLFSFTEDFCRYALENKNSIMKTYRFTSCPDEFFLQTLAYNSHFRDRLFHCDMRLIDWNRGTPYVWSEQDFDELISSDKLFARKFSSQHLSLVNRIHDRFMKGSDDDSIR